MTFTWLDTGLFFILLTQALAGMHKGLLRGISDIIGFALVAGAFLVAPHAAAGLSHTPLDLPHSVFLIAVLLLIPARILAIRLTSFFRGSLNKAWQKKADRILGVLPGLVWGGAASLALSLLYVNFLGMPTMQSPLAKTVLALGKAPISSILKQAHSYPRIHLDAEGWRIEKVANMNKPL
ncbi:MAG TPA: hypothetical protein DD435_01780 [Cyanobacteria bacterium UBA8530]|nr:hypothetical protein [Cyanobacteria bacterium UBA8530]